MLSRSIARSSATLRGPTAAAAVKPNTVITRGFHGRSSVRPSRTSGGIIQSGIRPSSRINRNVSINLVTPKRNITSESVKELYLNPLIKGLVYMGAGFLLVTTAVAAYSLPNLLAPIQADTYIPKTLDQETIEDEINEHPFVIALRADPDFHESRPHLKYPSAFRDSSLTAGTLQGTGKLEVPPYMWINPDKSELVSIGFLGRDLCGHPGLIHGGLMATLLDEALARCAFESLPSRICVTASLKVDFKAPLEADSYIVIKCKTIKTEGRKCWVEGTIETLHSSGPSGVVIAKAEALMIEPKSKLMGVLGKNLTNAISPRKQAKIAGDLVE